MQKFSKLKKGPAHTFYFSGRICVFNNIYQIKVILALYYSQLNVFYLRWISEYVKLRANDFMEVKLQEAFQAAFEYYQVW